MKTVKLKDKEFRVSIPQEKIQSAIKEMAKKLIMITKTKKYLYLLVF